MYTLALVDESGRVVLVQEGLSPEEVEVEATWVETLINLREKVHEAMMHPEGLILGRLEDT